MIAAVSGAVLLLALFLPWVGADVDGAPSFSGWEANNSLDIYLFILAIFAIVPAVLTMTGGTAELPFASSATTFLLGAIGTIMTVYVFLDVPDGAARKFGLILATLAVIAVTIGGYLGMQDEAAEY